MKRQIMDGTEQVEVEGYTGRVKVIVEGDTITALACCYFALCENEATTTRTNPILGEVPTCERCDAKIEALG
jgi:hypothetical protein